MGRVDVFEVIGVGDFAGHAAHGQAVAAIRGDRQMEHDVVQPQHIRGGGAGLGGARRQHQDAGMVSTQIEFGGRADHAVTGAPVGLAGGDRQVARQHAARKRDHDQITDGEVRCSTDDVAELGFAACEPKSTLTPRMGFLNSVSSSIAATLPTVSGPLTGPTGMISSTSWPMRMSVCSSSSADTSHPGAPAWTVSRSQL